MTVSSGRMCKLDGLSSISIVTVKLQLPGCVKVHFSFHIGQIKSAPWFLPPFPSWSMTAESTLGTWMQRLRMLLPCRKKNHKSTPRASSWSFWDLSYFQLTPTGALRCWPFVHLPSCLPCVCPSVIPPRVIICPSTNVFYLFAVCFSSPLCVF